MTGKIFKSIFLTALAVLMCALAIVFFINYNNYNSRISAELRDRGDFKTADEISPIIEIITKGS